MISPVGVVIVTFNRKDKLKKALEAYDQQQLLPCEIIVVNNASTDGTDEFLKQWQTKASEYKKVIITSAVNAGGSGGFFLGEKRALEDKLKWVMIADDDAYPASDYIDTLYSFIKKDADTEHLAVICGKVEEHGKIVNIHRTMWKSRWDRNFHQPVPESEYRKSVFYPDFASYVGIIINGEILRKTGLVDRKLFIWCDDTEHTYRLRQYGRIICIPQATIFHDVAESNHALSWKSYYGYRNDLLFFKKHFPTHFPVIVGKLLIKTLLCPLRGRSLTEVKLRMTAIKDACFNNKGINKLYRPGWKASNK